MVWLSGEKAMVFTNESGKSRVATSSQEILGVEVAVGDTCVAVIAGAVVAIGISVGGVVAVGSASVGEITIGITVDEIAVGVEGTIVETADETSVVVDLQALPKVANRIRTLSFVILAFTKPGMIFPFCYSSICPSASVRRMIAS
jgi:hypothetical protein